MKEERASERVRRRKRCHDYEYGPKRFVTDATQVYPNGGPLFKKKGN